MLLLHIQLHWSGGWVEEVSDKTSACVVSLQKHVECVTDEEQRA